MGSIGIIMIAMGHENYFKMGINLAASIKRNSPTLHITIITDKDYKDNVHVFDCVKVCPYNNPIKVKTLLYTLSPYDKTIYLDVDMLILPDRNLLDLFSLLEGESFQIMNVAKSDEHSIWAPANEIRKYCSNYEDPLPVYYSELIYFEKNNEASIYFRQVYDVYTNSKLRGREFANDMADELAYIIASMQLRFFPKKINWLPIFWFYRDKKDTHLQPYSLSEKYYGYSIGGNHYPEYVKAHYDNLVAYYSQVMKIANPYKALDKRNFLTNRSKI